MSFRPRLWPHDLVRYRRVLQKKLAQFLPDYDFQIGPGPEPHSDLAAPLAYLGRPLGYVSVSLKPGREPASPAVLAIWPSLADSALENLALRKALSQEPETGLFNREYFLFRLNKLLLQTLEPSESGLTLAQEDHNPGQVAVATLALNPGQTPLKRWQAKALRDLNPLYLARLDRERLGLVVPGDPETILLYLNDFRDKAKAFFPGQTLPIGYALAPKAQENPPASRQVAETWLWRALMALRVAVSPSALRPVVEFGDLVANHGTITQVLPQDRVVVSLGLDMGAQAGQVFEVTGSSGEVKGQIALFEIASNFSLANVMPSQRSHFTCGDRLTLAQSAAPKLSSLTSSSLDDLNAPANFTAALDRLAKDEEPLAVALIAIDDGEKLATLAGPAELDRRIGLIKAAVSQLRTAAATARLSDSKVAFAFKLSLEEALILAQNIQKAGDFSASIGLTAWPKLVDDPADLLSAAEKALLEAFMTGPKTIVVFGPQCLNIAGDRLFEAGDITAAMAEYRKGLVLDPGQPNLLNSLGVCYGRQGDHQAALEVFDQVLAQEPDNLMALFNKSCSLLLVDRVEEALDVLKLAKANPETGFDVYYQYGRLTLERGQAEEALAALQKAITFPDLRGEIYRLLGQAELLAGDELKAFEAFKKAVKHDPDDAQSLSSLGVLYLEKQNDREVALSLFQRSVEIDPTNSLFRQRLGKLLFDRGDFAGATHHLNSAVEYGCRAPDARRRLEEAASFAFDSGEGQDQGQLANPKKPNISKTNPKLLFARRVCD
ncbi:MAG: tetratricopeptide repeat protein [Deltaproteobacteria bacterium]|nr:tetratricopeptide repeat protein [Deltaproteobacteria bacterium]